MKSQLTGKDPGAGKDGGEEEKGTTEDEMVGWHHQLNGHGFEQTLGESEGQGSLGQHPALPRASLSTQVARAVCGGTSNTA